MNATARASRAAQRHAWAWQALYLSRQAQLPAPIERVPAHRVHARPGIASTFARGPAPTHAWLLRATASVR